MKETIRVIIKKTDERYGREVEIPNTLAAIQEAVGGFIAAKNLVGSGELMTSFDIWLRFPQNGAPTIEVSREYLSKKGLSLYLGATWEEERAEREES